MSSYFAWNLEKVRTNSEQYTLKIMRILKTASLASNFTGSYKKKVYIYLFVEFLI